MSFLQEQDLKTDIKAGTAYSFDFTTTLADTWNLKCFLDAKLPEEFYQLLKTEMRAGTSFGFGFDTGFPESWHLKTEARAGRVFAYNFETELADTWHLKTDIRAKSLITLSFTTAFDPKKRTGGHEILGLYRQNATDHEVLTLPINWVSKGVDRTFSLDVWYGRYQDVLLADDVRLSVYSFGADNRLGKEIVDNGYFQAKKSTDASYIALTASNYLSLGPMQPHNKKAIDVKLSVPVGASSTGLVFLGLKLEVLRSVIYGRQVFGNAIYGEYRKAKPEAVLVKVHIV